MEQSQVQSIKDGKFWKTQVDLAVAVRNTYERWWDANLRAYAPTGADRPDAFGADIHTNRTFVLVERKKADLFYQRPDVTLEPSPLMEGPILSDQVDPATGAPVPLMGPPDAQGQPQPISQLAAVQTHQEIVNEKLGEDGVDATGLMDQVLFDILATQGVGATEMGYESVTVEQEELDPMTGQPVTVPVPIYESCFWEHFSGKQLLIPHNFRSTHWDKAPWLGRQFELPLTPANRQKFKLPAEFTGAKASEAKQRYDHGADQSAAEDVFTGVVIWYRSALYRPDRPHPEHFTLLVLVDGIDAPVIEMDSPHQTLDPRGGLTPDSLIGNPIHPFSVRTLTDSAYVPSDGTMIRPLEHELNVFRTQMVQYRDAQTLKWVYNAGTVPKEVVDNMVRSPIGGMIGAPPELFPLEHNLVELPHGSMPRESFTSNDYIDNDIARTTAIDASGAGVQSQGSSTATEQQIVAANANARLDKERGILLKRYLKGVTKYSTLIQRYLPVEQAAKIVGPQRAQVWDVWRRQAASELAFTALPDSALRVDQAIDRKAAVELYSFLANDPFVQKGRMKLLEKLLRKHHIDPTGILQPPDPPKPEPPKLAFSFKGEDLVGPQAPIVLEIMAQNGIQISPTAVMQSQQLLLQAEQMAAAEAAAQEGQEGNPEHGGKLAQQESLSKHHADRTGAMQGVGGAPTPMGAGGMVS